MINFNLWFFDFNIAPLLSILIMQKLPGVLIADNELNFKKHVGNLCKKAYFKLDALRRIRGSLAVEKKKYFLMHSLMVSLITIF